MQNGWAMIGDIVWHIQNYCFEDKIDYKCVGIHSKMILQKTDTVQ